MAPAVLGESYWSAIQGYGHSRAFVVDKTPLNYLYLGLIAKALPRGEFPIKEIGPDHPIYRTLFPITEIPQVPSMQFWRMSGGATSEMDEYSAKAHMAALAAVQNFARIVNRPLIGAPVEMLLLLCASE